MFYIDHSASIICLIYIVGKILTFKSPVHVNYFTFRWSSSAALHTLGQANPNVP